MFSLQLLELRHPSAPGFGRGSTPHAPLKDLCSDMESHHRLPGLTAQRQKAVTLSSFQNIGRQHLELNLVVCIDIQTPASWCPKLGEHNA